MSLPNESARPMMACGHRANAICSSLAGVQYDPPIPSCAICDPPDSITPAVKEPDLTNRQARCDCGRLVPSVERLAFFEYRGPGSPASRDTCQRCGYHATAHEACNPQGGLFINESSSHTEARVCWNFEPHGPYEYDRYYCGCKGWD